MLAQRRRRWANIKPTLFQCVVFGTNTMNTAEPYSVDTENTQSHFQIMKANL